MLETILDILLDSLILFPFIFLIYVILEGIESVTAKERIEKALKGKFAPLISSPLGVIPQCGLSVWLAKLFENGLIKVGTLISAFLVISDEGLVILIKNGTSAVIVFKFILIKVVYAIIVGVLLNFLLPNFNTEHVCPEKDECSECGEKHSKWYDKFIFHPLLHALKVFIYVLIVNFVFGLAIYFIGESNIIAFTSKNAVLSPLLCAIVGLIPNCASSVILAEGFSGGFISFAGLLSGLSVNAGVGLTILFGKGKNIKKAFAIMGLLLFFGLLLGYIAFIFNF